MNNENYIYLIPKKQMLQTSPARSYCVKVVSLQSKNVFFRGSIFYCSRSQLKKEHKDFKLESSSQYVIDGRNGKQLLFTATDNNLQNRKALQIITMDKNNIFIITYKASIDNYAKYENIIKDMIGSFKLLS